MSRNRGRTLLLLALGGTLAVVAALRLGIDRPPGGALGLAWPDPDWARYRWTALGNAAAAGASLGLAGLLLQTLLRNPLASPYVLGASSGAGLGIMASLYLAHLTGAAALSPAQATGPALLGSLGALGVVLGLTLRRGGPDPVTMLLVGVVVSTLCGAGILFFQHLVPMGLRGAFATWLMGHVPQATPLGDLLLLCLLPLLGLGLVLRLAPALDASALGDDEARSIGVPLGALRAGGYALAGLLTAGAVAVTGPIGFVGLIAPHLARSLLGPRHGWAAPGSALAGAGLLVLADTASQALDLGAGPMPPGVFTVLAGGPVFLVLLLRGARRWGFGAP
jgi:iron complex transport system permease protein